MDEPIILASARKRGYRDADILHAYRNPIDEFIQDDDMLMKIGGTPSGALMEVGVLLADDGTALITHTFMPARPKYLRIKRR